MAIYEPSLTHTQQESVSSRVVEVISHALAWFFDSWRFAVFALSAMLFFTLLVAAILLVPPASGTGLSSFAAEFRMWCFGYDPTTGKMDLSYVITFFTSPLMLAVVIFAIWGKKLAAIARENRRAMVPFIAIAAMLVACCAVGFAAMYKPPLTGELPFPAERLRTQHRPPALALINHRQQTMSWADFRGKVVLLTAVYSTCGYTCPMIFAQMKRAFAKLTTSERAQLRVLAVTLDPVRDRPALLAKAAQAHQLHAPFFHFLTGVPAQVNKTLDDFGFARERDAKSGQINHVNLFILLDTTGRIAYRFSLGERQEQWLVQALRLLIQEATKAKHKA